MLLEQFVQIKEINLIKELKFVQMQEIKEMVQITDQHTRTVRWYYHVVSQHQFQQLSVTYKISAKISSISHLTTCVLLWFPRKESLTCTGYRINRTWVIVTLDFVMGYFIKPFYFPVWQSVSHLVIVVVAFQWSKIVKKKQLCRLG